MTIKFYFMDGCGHCVHAKNDLKDEIGNGTIKMLPSSRAPKGVNGFPHFVNGKNSVSGYSGSKEDLFRSLGVRGIVGGGTVKKTKLNKWQQFLKKNSGKGWSITKMKNEYKKI